jgi:hypothetical protein
MSSQITKRKRRKGRLRPFGTKEIGSPNFSFLWHMLMHALIDDERSAARPKQSTVGVLPRGGSIAALLGSESE